MRVRIVVRRVALEPDAVARPTSTAVARSCPPSLTQPRSTRPGRSWSCPTASPTSTPTPRDGSIQWSPTTGGVAVALDALMRDRGGVWIAHGSGDADRDVVDRHDRVVVPPRPSRLHPAPALADAGGGEAVLRGLRKRGPVAAMPRGTRTAHLPEAGLGAVPAGQRPVCRRNRGRASRPVGAGLHSGLPPCARRSAPAASPTGREDGDFLAHPMGPARTGCASAPGAASCWRASWGTTSSPFSSIAIAATS